MNSVERMSTQEALRRLAAKGIPFATKMVIPAETMETSPCTSCGDKTNVAEVKASPAAQEKLLSGES